MNCNWSTGDIILSAIIIVFTFWTTSFSKWVIVIAAAIMFIHAIVHRNMHGPMMEKMPAKSASNRRK